MICNQLQNRSGFFVCMTLAMMEITQNSLAVNLTDCSALIYQALHLAKSLPFTDKSLENAGLSVKCVLLTDKSAKNGTLSVNLNEIFDKSVEQHCI